MVVGGIHQKGSRPGPRRDSPCSGAMRPPGGASRPLPEIEELTRVLPSHRGKAGRFLEMSSRN